MQVIKDPQCSEIIKVFGPSKDRYIHDSEVI